MRALIHQCCDVLPVIGLMLMLLASTVLAVPATAAESSEESPPELSPVSSPDSSPDSSGQPPGQPLGQPPGQSPGEVSQASGPQETVPGAVKAAVDADLSSSSAPAASPAPKRRSRSIDELRRGLDVVVARVGRVRVGIESLQEEYRSIELKSRKKRFAERLRQAIELFKFGDFLNTTVVLHELINDAEHRDHSAFGKAAYLMAEAQFRIDNKISAREFFRLVLKSDDPGLRYKAVVRLIEISDAISRWDGLLEDVKVLEAEATLPEPIAYQLAKSMVRQGEYTEAQRLSTSISQDHPLFNKGRFLSAVALLQLGDADASRALFDDIAADSRQYPDSREVRDLAAMNSARILLEQGELLKAIDSYQFVSEQSSFLTRRFLRSLGRLFGRPRRKRTNAKRTTSMSGRWNHCAYSCSATPTPTSPLKRACCLLMC